MASRRRQAASDDAGYDYDYDRGYGQPQRRRTRLRNNMRGEARSRERRRQRNRAEVSQPFKCRHCKAFIGLPLTGGRQRNHCPGCLYSLHVDGKTPGDRASDCRSLMAPAGAFFRPNGEQVVLHRCLGCGFERHNRVAADDSPLLLMRLPLVAPRLAGRTEDQESSATA